MSQTAKKEEKEDEKSQTKVNRDTNSRLTAIIYNYRSHYWMPTLSLQYKASSTRNFIKKNRKQTAKSRIRTSTKQQKENSYQHET